jgi:hypothetical protein
VLGPSFLPELASWKSLWIGDDICVSVHPELNAQQVSGNGKSITLLGYLLDPDHPRADDLAILNGLLEQMSEAANFGQWVKNVDGLGGRWILILADERTTTLLTDPMGLRQVFYTDESITGGVWCATDPGVIARPLKLGMDPVAVSEYINSEPFQKWTEYLWPADTSPYREIRHLLPNHRLDLYTGECSRYWPDGPIGTLSLEDGVRISAHLLKGLLSAAAARFSLAHAMSAGWDSRLLLAASKDICRDVYYFTYSRRVPSADLSVTPRLLSGLGLKHHVLTIPERMDDDFAAAFRSHVTLARDFCGRFIQALEESFPEGRVCVTGNAAEIVRVRFRLPEGAATITAKHLARFTSFQFPDQMEKIPFVVHAWERWLAGLGNTYDVHPLDVFYWEHWGGNFAGADQTEGDMVIETFTPYNCRRLLTAMLSTDDAFRDHDLPILYRETAAFLWPEVLAEPVNPPLERSFATKVRQRLLRALSVPDAAR